MRATLAGACSFLHDVLGCGVVSFQMEGEDYMLLHPRAYELLEAWYGGGPRFKRWVVSLGSTTHTQLTVELFPVK